MATADNQYITLYAQWELIEYPISYNLNGGEVYGNPETYNVEDESITLINPTKDRCEFIGWSGTGLSGIAKTVIIPRGSIGDREYEAHYRGAEYRITYVLDGGTNDNSNPNSYYYSEGVESLKEAYKQYCEFKGWYLEPEYENRVTSIGIETYGDITLYAKWEYKYTVDDPEVKVEAGEVERGTLLDFRSNVPDTKIYYRLNEEGEFKELTDLIVVEEDIVVEVYASKEGMKDSEVKRYEYIVEEISLEDIDINEEDKEMYTEVEDIPENMWTSKIEDKEYDPGISSYTQDIRVYNGTTLLEINKDYTVKYSNNKKAGKATVTITGKGNYTGTITKSFNIKPVEVNEGNIEVVLNRDAFTYNGSIQKASVAKVIYKGKALKNNTDYKVVYENASSRGAGTYRVTVNFVGNYSGSIDKEYTIDKRRAFSLLTVSGIVNKQYTGEALTQDNLVVKDGTSILTKGIDYTVYYENNREVGIASIVISPIDTGKYVGTIEKTFNITGIALSKAVFNQRTLSSEEYDGNEKIKTDIVLSYKKDRYSEAEELHEGVDYTVSYTNNVNKGTATITYTGMGRFTGSVKKTFKIIALPIVNTLGVLNGGITIKPVEEQSYVKGGVKPDVDIYYNGKKLELNKDYTLSYKNNTKANNPLYEPMVIIKGKGNYSGSVSRSFKISQADISLLEISAVDKVYQNKYGIYKSVPSIVDSNGKKLAAGTDYEKTIEYTYEYDTLVVDGSILSKPALKREAGEIVGAKDIIPVGTVIRVTVTGKGNYYGEVSTVYKMTPVSIASAKVSIAKQVYTGKPVYLSKSDITVKVGTTVLGASDYKIVSYTNNIAKGSGSVVIRGKGSYGGSKTIKFSIQAYNISQTIRFNSNGGTGVMADQSITKDVILKANTFKRLGYTFMGWSTRSNGPIEYTNKQLFIYDSNQAGLITNLYAIWMPMY